MDVLRCQARQTEQCLLSLFHLPSCEPVLPTPIKHACPASMQVNVVRTTLVDPPHQPGMGAAAPPAVQHVQTGRYFDSFDAAAGRYIPNAWLRSCYPEDGPW